MKIKYLSLVIATLLLVGLSNCSNDNEPAVDNPTETKSVFLKISNAPSSRAMGPAEEDGTEVEFISGNLYFTTVAGTILKHYSIGEAAGDTYTVGNLKTGQAITDLPGNVTNVYVVGNTPDLSASGTISTVQEKTIDVASQVQTADGNVVNLYGTSTLSLKTAGGGSDGRDLYEADVTLNPTVARVQLADIKSGGAITAFTVDAIYIDNYYAQAQVGGEIIAPLVDNGPNANLFDSSHATYAYIGDVVNAIHDVVNASAVDTDPIGGFILKPASGVWGYNLFAESAGSDVPRIIIKLSGVTATGMTFTDPQFITIKGFKDVTKIEAGKVYTIGVIDDGPAYKEWEFTEENLSPIPNLKAIDVNVAVTLAKWVEVPVEPEL